LAIPDTLSSSHSSCALLPTLPGGMLWKMDGFKYLGIHLGTTSYMQRNWDGFLDNMKQKLSRWKGMLQFLSLKAWVTIINNLILPTIWYKVIALQPPQAVITSIQKSLIDFFLGRQPLAQARCIV